MNKTIKIGVFIPGRLGSERLPNKLILPLNSKGDTLWSLACQRLQNLPEDIVTVALCNEDALINIAEKYGGITIIQRDQLTCEVDGPLNFIFQDLKDIEGVTHWMFLNPCLALLSTDTILESINEFKKDPSGMATSVKPYKNWLFNAENEEITPIDYDTLSTKEIYGLYEVAHVFHIFSTEFLFNGLKNQYMHDFDIKLIEVPKEECIDVDDIHDLEFLKWKLTQLDEEKKC